MGVRPRPVPAASNSLRLQVLEWWPGANEELTRWCKCGNCHSDVWRKGRKCIRGSFKHGESWFCRICWAKWSHHEDISKPASAQVQDVIPDEAINDLI